MRNRSLNRTCLSLFVTLLLCSGALQAQWLPNNATQTTTIYRSASVGVNTGSTVPNMLSVKNGSSLDGVSIDGTNPALILRNSSALGYFGLVTVAGTYFGNTLLNDIVLQSVTGKIHIGQGSTAPTLTVFGSNVGIGTTAPYYPFHIVTTNADTTGGPAQSGGNRAFQSASEVDLLVKPNGGPQASGAVRIGQEVWSSVDLNNTYSIGDVRGSEGDAENHGSGSVNTLTGTLGWAYNANNLAHVSSVIGAAAYTETDGGTVDSISNLDTWGGVMGGTVANQYGIRNQASAGSAVGTQYGIYSLVNGNATTRYGLYLDNGVGAVTTDYGIYQNKNSARNYFAGPVSVGNTGGAYAFNVFGAAAVTLGPDQSVPRWITYDDGTNASYTTYSADTSTQYKSTGAFLWKNVPYGATRMNATGTQTMFLDQVGNLVVQGQIISSTGGYRFPDGSVQTTAISGGGGGSVPASNIGSGNFGSCCSGGNFSFPALLTVANGLAVGTTATPIGVLDVRKAIVADTVGNLLTLGFSGTQSNRSVSVQQIGNAGTASQYLFLNGGLGATSTTAAPTFTSTYAPTFGIESNDSGMSLVTAANGTNITPIRALTVNSAGHIGIGVAPSSSYTVDVVGSLRATDVIGADYQDVAEWVPAGETLTPGMVVVLNHKHNNEVLESREPYDTAVAGVVSEHPGVVLGKSGPDKAKIATTGRVKVRVDASKNPIEIGDLLVTSEVAGAAMKSEPMEINGRRFHQPGTIIGKALEPLPSGTGEILVLLSLQ